jgi:hypothetical protein
MIKLLSPDRNYALMVPIFSILRLAFQSRSIQKVLWQTFTKNPADIHPAGIFCTNFSVAPSIYDSMIFLLTLLSLGGITSTISLHVLGHVFRR